MKHYQAIVFLFTALLFSACTKEDYVVPSVTPVLQDKVFLRSVSTIISQDENGIIEADSLIGFSTRYSYVVDYRRLSDCDPLRTICYGRYSFDGSNVKSALTGYSVVSSVEGTDDLIVQTPNGIETWKYVCDFHVHTIVEDIMHEIFGLSEHEAHQVPTSSLLTE